MGKIEELRSKVNNLNEQLNNGLYVRNIVADNEALIISMNADSQLYKLGENRLGVSISSYAPYAPLTIMIKKAKGQPTDRVTLRDTGDFESSFYLDVEDTYFEITAADFKTEKLMHKYGKDIFGLNEENLRILIWDVVYPRMIDNVKQELQ